MSQLAQALTARKGDPRMAASSEWTPPASVRDHSGGPIVAGKNFFVPPPTEIGDVVSAYSSLPLGKSPNPTRTRFRTTLTMMLVGVVLGGLAGIGTEGGVADKLGTMALGASVFAIPLGIITFLIMYLLRKDYRCDYVGKYGAAAFDLVRLRKGEVGNVLRFADAAALNKTETPVKLRGLVQVATSYEYTWVDPTGKPLFTISGEYYSSNQPPEDKYHFAQATESAWELAGCKVTTPLKDQQAE